MQTDTLVYIILIGIIALSLALFQYLKNTNKKLRVVLSILRFVSVFGVLLLLLNPKFEAVSFYEEKPNLVIAVDNSESINHLKQVENATNAYQQLITDERLSQKFNIESYKFGKETNILDSIDFSDNQSHFSNFFKSYNELHKGNTAPVVLISDGNQTIGSDYTYVAKQNNQPIYPVILGDTLSFSDLRLQQVNVNRYAYFKNRFPIEVIINYSGDAPIKSQLKISSGNNVLFSKIIELNDTKSSEIVNTTLNANRVGIKTYRVEILPLENEKNKVNNYKNFGVEIIDQKTNIALISDGLHPDLGAIKRSIESNEQRSVSILKPNDFISKSNDFQLVILYQPTNNFNSVFSRIQDLGINTFIITGNSTDFDFLNNIQSLFYQEITDQYEDYQPELNINYGTFLVNSISFDNYPPLQSEFGTLSFAVPEETILYKTVNGINTGTPLLSTYESGNNKYALLNGEGIWKWRAQNYLEQERFLDFDNFMSKLVQYLRSNKKRNRLNIDYRSFYNQNEPIIVNAQFFNKNYEFDANASLELTYKNKETDVTKTLPLLLKNSSYLIDLSGVEPGEYNFTIRNTDEPISSSGTFSVLEYNIEQQFLNADVTKLTSLSTITSGKSYFPNQVSDLIDNLINDSRYAIIQKSKRNVIPLIDWQYLLGLIVLSLSLEWFIRKYNGLI
ncbi:MAG: VWA domain-containing protein [Winogradskyella sp.]|uniref:VWA domain-containing protein n=1 Tax=Winogradskyella sp. TaxID=1883156 RepID=UPI000F3BDF25|nr:VWA domain-containing protein [Winogradskyella sp.]RNC86289.1 MAG: VWA domain-containing protein [Winogradskyella sp.]